MKPTLPRPRRPERPPAALLLALGAILMAGRSSAADWSGWESRQEFSVTAPGLVKLSLPPETLDAARADLADLRVVDANGNEVPFALERPRPVAATPRAARALQVSLEANRTVLLVETGFTEPLDRVALETPAPRFIKAVRVEGSTDRQTWKLVAEGRPIFRQDNGASQLQLPLPAGSWPFLRLSVDDRRSEAIPFTAVRLQAAASDATPTEPVTVRVVSRDEMPGQSRLTLDLGAAHLDLATLTLDVADALFTRSVTLAVREISENLVRERPLARGSIYRVSVEGQPTATSLTLPFEVTAPRRELVLLIQNDDSPPLQIASVTAGRRPVYLAFPAGQAGTFALLTRNPRATPPRYDVAALAENFKRAPVSSLTVTAPGANPAFRAREALADIPTGGTALDVSAWKYRKRVAIAAAGVQQLELDLETLAHAQPDFRDLRLLRDGRQLPFILEQTSLTRALTPQVAPANDPKRPKVSRWSIRLPHRALPVTELTLSTRTPLFNRSLALAEETPDERGEQHRSVLGAAIWTQTPERPSRQFSLALARPPAGDTLFLETDNQDNPPIELENFQLRYAATRLLFKAAAGETIDLSYGNAAAESPRYDLSLVAGQLLGAEKIIVTAAAEEVVGKNSWRDRQLPMSGGASTIY